jgi:F-type H+-transporting ATPase subunit epsilon
LAGSQLQILLVTPETTLVNEPATALRFPLYDGQIGILPGRAPLVGRLGAGELLITTATGRQSYFIDGGFVQVKGSVVSILTSRAVATSAIDAAGAEEELRTASARSARNETEVAARLADQHRARRKLALARKPR